MIGSCIANALWGIKIELEKRKKERETEKESFSFTFDGVKYEASRKDYNLIQDAIKSINDKRNNRNK